MTQHPFCQLAFRDLPERPPRAHGFFATTACQVALSSPRFGGNSACVRTHGHGPPLLLVHGLMTSSYSWRYVIEPLGRHFTLYIPDLPGAGDTTPLARGLYGPRTLACWLAALQRELGVRGCDVVGNSMGGYLGMWLALEDPLAVRRLVNIHSPGVPELRMDALSLLLSIPGVEQALSAWISLAPERWTHARTHYWDESLKSLEEARIYAAPLKTGAGRAAFIAYLRETMSGRGLRDFQRVLFARRERREPFPVPLLLTYARRDPLVQPSIGRALAAQTGAPLVWLERASHFAQVDAVPELLPHVLAFLCSPTSAGDAQR